MGVDAGRGGDGMVKGSGGAWMVRGWGGWSVERCSRVEGKRKRRRNDQVENFLNGMNERNVHPI